MNHSHLQIGMETLFRIQINLWNIGMKFWYLRRDTWMNRNTNVLCPPNCWLLAPRIIIDAWCLPPHVSGHNVSLCLSVPTLPHRSCLQYLIHQPIIGAQQASAAGICKICTVMQNCSQWTSCSAKICPDFSPVYFTWKSNRLTLPIQHSNVQLLTHMIWRF